jgi:antitoxin (DNA-binding transcriptional repressor) of toxin-antitoxin stability system
MSKRAVRVSEAEGANDFRSLLARVRAGVDVVIERDAEALAVVSLTAPHVCLLSRVSSIREGARLERNTRHQLRP